VAFAGSALIAVSHGGVQFGTAALIVLAAAVARGVYHTAHKPLLSRYTGFEVTVYADVADTLFVLPWSPALVRALPHAGTAARSGLCGRLRPGDPRIRHRRPLTDDPAEHGTAKRTLMPPIVRADNLRGVWAWCGQVRTRWRDVGRAGAAGSATGV
jgi:hypothetical protein